VTSDTGNAFTLDLAGEASLTVQPMAPDPADAVAQTAYSAELAGMCLTLGRSPITMRSVRQTLADVEAPLRPASMPATTPIFRGSLSPWGEITRSDLEQFFDGLQRIGFTAGAAVGVRPAEAMVTWIMEGKIAAEGYGLLAGATFVVVSDFLLVLINIPDSEVNGASESQIRAVIRSVLCWRFWGMDIMNIGNPARDGEPIYTGTLSASVANHNAKMDARLAEIRGFGITPPTRADVDAAVTVSRTASGAWQYTAGANHIEVYVALQHCEYLARIAELGVNPGPGDYPTFGYAAYNGGIARALELYADAQAIIAADPATWAGLTPEDAIGSFPLTSSEQPPIDPDERIPSARINGLHFGALVRSYGAVFPHVL
jgi:hypothetical protein